MDTTINKAEGVMNRTPTLDIHNQEVSTLIRIKETDFTEVVVQFTQDGTGPGMSVLALSAPNRKLVKLAYLDYRRLSFVV